MQEFLTWGALIIAGGSIVAVLTFWMNLGSRLTAAELRAETATKEAASSHDKYDYVVEKLADYRVAMAKDIAIIKTLAETNTTSVTAAENRVTKALEEVRDQLGKFNDRVDRIFESKT